MGLWKVGPTRVNILISFTSGTKQNKQKQER